MSFSPGAQGIKMVLGGEEKSVSVNWRAKSEERKGKATQG